MTCFLPSVRRRLAALVCALVVGVGAAASSSAAAPPARETYFTVLLGLEEPYAADPACLRFKGKKICTSDGLCGTWRRAGSGAFDFLFAYEEAGATVRIAGSARVEDTGAASSMAGAATLARDEVTLNFGLTGRAVKHAECARLLRQTQIDWTPNQPFQDGDCLLRADELGFGQPGESPYVLPFPPGTGYYLSQTYCYLFSTHRNELAYDFDIPLGGEIVAARAGEVIAVVEDRASDSPWPDANYLKIRHDDGTVASYIHVMRDSVLPALGDRVAQGEPIARSAMSGTLEAHLHFVVFRGDPATEGDDVPVNFRNCEGPIDGLGGLIQDQTYTARPD